MVVWLGYLYYYLNFFRVNTAIPSALGMRKECARVRCKWPQSYMLRGDKYRGYQRTILANTSDASAQIVPIEMYYVCMTWLCAPSYTIIHTRTTRSSSLHSSTLTVWLRLCFYFSFFIIFISRSYEITSGDT